LFWNRDQYTSRHRLVFNVVWEVPVGRGRRFLTDVHKAADYILGGWDLYWIAYMESGPYFSPSFSGTDPSRTDTFGGLPDRVANGNFSPDARDINRWFDAAAFVVPPAGRFGNSGAYVLEGPGLHQHNTTISKRLAFSERISFNIGAAITNIFNMAAFNVPASNISVPGSVGRVSSTKPFAPNRQIMMRFRLDF
jgi:hypothetical protein